ncbi:MAG: cobyrinate a,c-diamide synthase [Nitrospirae bacterium]|nr:cobyrinate a,c-diamide synthase [Nitrospirota bacterium]
MKVKQYHYEHSCPRVVIAGLKGGSGKTIITLGIIKAWRDKDLKIVPFKKGPDYIDAGWLAYAADQPCYNLDPFLVGKEKILTSFLEHTIDFDGAIIEGNRGLYDGMDVDGTYSTAELSKIIRSPTILVLDCTKTTRTLAAMVIGCKNFDKEMDIRGVILNQIANSRQESLIRNTFEHYSDLPVLGALPRIREELFLERHMGLTPYQEYGNPKEAIDAIGKLAKEYIDLDGIWKIAKEAPPLNAEFHPLPTPPPSRGREGVGGRLRTTYSELKIGVIKDSAFQFYYPENFTELVRRGATLIEINALKDREIPEVDALYIGGGFPETHALALSENIHFRTSLRNAIEEGLPVYAECGGLMYLGEALLLEDTTYPMSGIFPIVFCLEKMPQAHGYTIVNVERDNPYFPVGCILRGHEFHYSKVINQDITAQLSKRDDIYFAFKMERGQGLIDKMDAICYKNVLATYTHLHASGSGEWANGLIRQANFYKEKRLLETKKFNFKIALTV